MLFTFALLSALQFKQFATTRAATKTYMLASGLSASRTYTIELYKVSEARLAQTEKASVVTLRSLSGSASMRVETPPARPTRRLEFLGDSITAGYGNLCGHDGLGQSQLKAASNHYLAWGSVLCRSLGAECHTTAWSGRGLVVNRNGRRGSETMPHVYRRTLVSVCVCVWLSLAAAVCGVSR